MDNNSSKHGISPVTAQRLAVIALVAVGMLPLLWPGDTPWINDEPLLLHKAIELRDHPGDFFKVQGLQGTVGISYGPVSVWIYALLLGLSRQPMVLVIMRAALFMSIILWSLLWLSKTLPRLRPAAAIAFVASPYVWLYSRQLWDNTFVIPFSSLAFAAYVSFCKKPRRLTIGLTFMSLCVCALVHPMTLPLILVLTTHAILFHCKWLRAHLRTVITILFLVVVFAIPWLLAIVRDLVHANTQLSSPWPAPSIQPPHDPAVRWWTILISPLFGGRLLSAQGFDYFLCREWWAHPAWLPPLVFITLSANLFVWIGLGRAALQIYNGLRGWQPKNLDFHLALIAATVVVINWLMQTMIWHYPHPHYFNGAWIVFASMAWTTMTSPSGKVPVRLGLRSLGALHTVSLLVVLCCVIIGIHRSAGNRGIHFGPSLSTQVEAAAALGRFHPASEVQSEVDNYRMFPHALPVLRELIGATGDPRAERGSLTVRYRNPGSKDGWLEVDVDSTR